MYYNCGASFNGERVKTKRQLKELLASDPTDVYFDGTSMFQTVDGYRGSEIPEDVTLSVVMPDPFTDRRSYASVKLVNGKPKLS